MEPIAEGSLEEYIKPILNNLMSLDDIPQKSLPKNKNLNLNTINFI